MSEFGGDRALLAYHGDAPHPVDRGVSGKIFTSNQIVMFEAHSLPSWNDTVDTQKTFVARGERSLVLRIISIAKDLFFRPR